MPTVPTGRQLDVPVIALVLDVLCPAVQRAAKDIRNHRASWARSADDSAGWGHSLALSRRITVSAARLNKYHHKVPTTVAHTPASTPCCEKANPMVTIDTGMSAMVTRLQSIPRNCKLGRT